MTTLRIDAGRTDKLRPGDIVGALTGDAGLPEDAIGKIDVFATRSYVAIARAPGRQRAGTAARRQDQGPQVPGQPDLTGSTASCLDPAITMDRDGWSHWRRSEPSPRRP